MKKSMKTAIGLALAAVMVFGCAVTSFAAETAGITVNGRGMIEVDPDTAKIYADVETTADTSIEAQTENNEKADALKNAMLAAGIAEENIITESSYVSPERVYDDETRQYITTGYTAYANISFATKDIDNAGKYMDTALEAGAAGSSVSFYLEDTSVYYADALRQAVKAAENSAKTIAGACGVTIKGITAVNESTSNYAVEEATANTTVMYEGSTASDSAAKGRSVIEYDKITINARVSITYAI